jgi:hypothetical protein
VALFGDLEGLQAGTGPVVLRHGLESVRIISQPGEQQHDPLSYGDVTAQAVAMPEAIAARSRVYCMPITSASDTPGQVGQPTLWSATVDALAVGAEVVGRGSALELLSAPDPERARLRVLSAGNVDQYVADHLGVSDLSPVQDPGQAWKCADRWRV